MTSPNPVNTTDYYTFLQNTMSTFCKQLAVEYKDGEETEFNLIQARKQIVELRSRIIELERQLNERNETIKSITPDITRLYERLIGNKHHLGRVDEENKRSRQDV